MKFLIFLFAITLTTVFIYLQIEKILMPPILKGLLISVSTVFLTIFVYLSIKKMNSTQILFGFLGFLVGIFTGFFLTTPFLVLSENLRPFAFILLMSFGYAGAILGFKKAEKMKLTDILWIIKKEAIWEEPKILDTSVLIDGRIADLIELGFVKGTILIPRFVLKEIQYIADSPDPLRRAKGRRALDTLHRIQRVEKLKFEIIEKDLPEIKEIDIKLVELSRTLKGTLITNDSNLVKITQLRGVSVLNLNELAQAMRPPVLPGEALKLFVAKEGKEHEQGVAYLDNGTMVVIEEGRRYIGKTIDVVIHSVIQTSTGRMIFGKPKIENQENEQE